MTERSKSSNQKFGSYVLLDHIADGGMAEIFLAKRQGYSGFEKFVALKRILPNFNEHTAFREMLIHEAKLAANLQHLNVVQVLDLGAVEGQVYIAMDYIHGRDLASLLARNFRRKECIPLALALSMAIEFLTGIDYAHRLQDDQGQPRNLIHRDISPQNILISYEGEVKVTDFGIARAFSSDGGIEKLFPGSLQGKFGYMSPEQLRKQDIDQRADIFSAGVVLHELITGKRLFWHKNPKEAAAQILNKEIPTPSSIDSKIPKEIDDVVMKALQRDKESRYQTIGSLLGDIAKVADNLNVHISRRDIAVYMRRHFGTNSPRPRSTDAKRARSLTLPKISLASSFSATSGLRTPVGDILINRGDLTVSQLDIGLAQQRARGGRIGEILIEQGVISDRALVMALGEQIDARVCEPGELLRKPPSPVIFDIFPYDAADSMAVFTLELATAQEPRPRVVVSDPFDERTLLETKIILGVNELDLALATKDEIKQAIHHWYHHAGKAEDETLMFNMQLPIQGFREASEQQSLIVFQNEELLKRLQSDFSDHAVNVVGIEDLDPLKMEATKRNSEIIVLNCSNQREKTIELIKELRAENRDICLFVIDENSDLATQVALIDAGANDCFSGQNQFPVIVAKARRELSRTPNRSSAALITKSHNLGVSGSLSDMTFVDVIQSIELAQKTAVVSFSYEDGRAGTVTTSNGKVRAVSSNDSTLQDGNLHFHHLAIPGSGRFEIAYKDSDVPSNVTENNTQLLLEAIRKHTEHETGAEVQDNAKNITPSVNQAPSTLNRPYDYPSEEDSTTELQIESLKNLARSQGGEVDDSNIFTWSPVISEKSNILESGGAADDESMSESSFDVDILEPTEEPSPVFVSDDTNDEETEMAFDAAGLFNKLAAEAELENPEPISIDKESLMARQSSSSILATADPLETLESQPIQKLESLPAPLEADRREDLADSANEEAIGPTIEIQAKEERMGPNEPAAPKYNLQTENDIFALPKLDNQEQLPLSQNQAEPDEEPLPLPVDALTALPNEINNSISASSPRKKSEGQSLARLNLQKVAIKKPSSSSNGGAIEEKVSVQHINMSKQELPSDAWDQKSENSLTEAEESEDLILSIDDIVADDEDLF